jgi:hypothetical protein
MDDALWFFGDIIRLMIWITTRKGWSPKVKRIYLWKNARQHGPYSIADARMWLSSDLLQASDLACYEGGSTWEPLSVLMGSKRTNALPWIVGASVALLLGIGMVAILAFAVAIGANPQRTGNSNRLINSYSMNGRAKP